MRATDSIVSKEDLPEWAQLQASITEHPIVKDDSGVLRYQRSSAIDWLFRTMKIDLNAMRVAYCHGAFSREDYMEFYRDMGYSLAGFEEVFDEELSEIEEAQSGSR